LLDPVKEHAALPIVAKSIADEQHGVGFAFGIHDLAESRPAFRPFVAPVQIAADRSDYGRCKSMDMPRQAWVSLEFNLWVADRRKLKLEL